MFKRIFNNNNIPYVTIPVAIFAFIFLGIAIFNYLGITNLVSNNFYSYINKDSNGQVAGEYSVQMAVGNNCTHYVSPSASSGSGTQSNPWSIDRAFASDGAKPGNVVCFRGGLYQPADQQRYAIRANGTANDWIIFRNYPGETPIIDGSKHTQPIANAQFGLDIGGDYVMLKGFELRNFHYSGGIKIRGSYVTLEDNFIHHNAEHNWDPPPGKPGIICDVSGGQYANATCGYGITSLPTSSSYGTRNLTIRGNIIWANGHAYGFDQGLYLKADNSLVERNIFAFNAASGAGSRSLNSKFYHNIFYKNKHVGTGDNIPATNNSWKNNIVVGGDWAFMHSSGVHDISHFLIYHPNGPDGWNKGRPPLKGDGTPMFDRSNCSEWSGDINEVTAWKYYCEARNTIEANPMFVDPPTAHDDFSFDFHLRAGSPAIDSGQNLGESFVGSAPDRGVYEYGDSGGNGGSGDSVSKIFQTDFNNDNKTDIQDFGILLSNWHKTGSNILNKKIDINKDSIINVIDLSKLLSCWGTPPEADSPECWMEQPVIL
ncbi:MAG: hypothetical protein ABIA91_00070 [Patescibacteria group bacterium]